MKYWFLLWLALTLAGPVWVVVSGQIDFSADYRTANRDSAHLAPDPRTTQDAVIQAYAARAFSWRGLVARHCWIAVKPRGASQYTVYQVIGWRTYRGLSALSIAQDIPDRNWFGQTPRLLLDIRGARAESIIPAIDKAARAYPDAGPYVLWPGPNSNSFPAYVARAVPDMGLVMPSDAVGKDYLAHGFIARAPSATGYQVSLFGLLGMLIAKQEGIELNLLGLVYGIRFHPFEILLPGFAS